MDRPEIDRILNTMPNKPGVYLMKDEAGDIIYVGKAQDLKSRVRQYFAQSGDSRHFVKHLPRLLGQIDTIVTSNVKEALILENDLIKKYQPRFNVLLRDDKNFLHIQIDRSETWPRLRVVRRLKHDGKLYFGPFHSASKLRATLKLIEKYFQLRTCDQQSFRNRTRPCLEYQIKRCSAPCVLPVSRDEYMQRVDEVVLFLQGKTHDLESRLRSRMMQASESLRYEEAARYRDQLNAVRDSLQEQNIVKTKKVDQDVWGIYREGGFLTITILNIRDGRLTDTKNYEFEKQGVPTEELLSTVCNLYYENGGMIPDQILLSHPAEHLEELQDSLCDRRGRKVSLSKPRRGASRRLVELACVNAEHSFFQSRQETISRHQGLDRLQKLLGLSTYPEVIECYDISLFQGGEPVGARVTMVGGMPDRKQYRHYKIKTVEGTDDFAMMREVLMRRLQRGIREGELPNLIVVDGGRGQLNVALAVAKDLGIDSIDIVGLAKARVQQNSATISHSSERVFRSDTKNPIVLKPHTDEFRLLTSLRDEAHRFAITFHRKLRRGRNFKSILDGVTGLGRGKQTHLIRHFGGLQALEKATLSELQAVTGIGPKLAQKIHNHFRGV